MQAVDYLPASGELAVERIPNPRPVDRQLTHAELLYHGLPRAGQPREVREWKARQANEFLHGLAGVKAAAKLARRHHLMAPYGLLWLQKITASGQATDLGLVSCKIVTTDGVDYIANNFAATASYSVANFKFHGIGTSSTAAVVGDRALVTELTTQYSTDNVRPTGTQVKGGTGIYTTVGTVTVDASVAATEWGLFTQAATGAQSQPANSMLDRVVYTVVNLASGDSLQATFTLTFPNGG
jgi:hypothetical protein